ncbi:histidine phosphotransfer domain-containing protein [Nitrospira sp.]|nr:histidine phosphotransfer domain-containing protein [Nitrospira sp.]
MSTVPAPESGKIAVRIDPALQDLIPQFLANRQRDIATLRQASDSADFALVQTLGHRMKGDGGGYGFEGISDIGAVLEAAAARRDRACIARQIERLDDYIARLDITFEE